ncbi:MAG: hypothetical protein JXA43_03415 [Candidatus Diapherotrites archaeon]|nr:hypothetical protein [Candidatus Diapherotrites archaeon]
MNRKGILAELNEGCNLKFDISEDAEIVVSGDLKAIIDENAFGVKTKKIVLKVNGHFPDPEVTVNMKGFRAIMNSSPLEPEVCTVDEKGTHTFMSRENVPDKLGAKQEIWDKITDALGIQVEKPTLDEILSGKKEPVDYLELIRDLIYRNQTDLSKLSIADLDQEK